MMYGDINAVLIPPDASIRDAAACINANRTGIALVTDPDGKLSCALTDGDIRRGVLAGVDLSQSVQVLLSHRTLAAPISAKIGTSRAELLHLMKEQGILQVPLLDEAGRVVDLALMKDFVREGLLPLEAVVMAGGFGTRLHPLTHDTPKPMLRVGEKPLLEHIVGQLQTSGIRSVKLTTHYKPDAISSHFGNGSEFGLDISYVNEVEPLGTAGALGLAETSKNEPVLLINGDILTQVDFRAMLEFHRSRGAELTVGVRQFEFKVPYGVLHCDGEQVRRIEEKPLTNYLVNAGIYLIEPSAQELIPAGRRFDMTDLISELAARGRQVVAFPIFEYWLDIGRPEDYTKAQEDIQTWNQ